MTRGLAEILQMAAKEKRNVDKVTVLHIHDTPQLRKMIKYVMDPTVLWWEFLKGSPPPYTPNRYMDAEGQLYAKMRLLYMFVEQGDDFMGLKNDQHLTRFGLQRNPKKREQLWQALLEGISPEDALLLCAAPRKEFPFKGLPRSVIDEAFPGLLSPEPEAGQVPIMSIPPQVEQPPHGIPPQRPATEIVELSIEDILGEKLG